MGIFAQPAYSDWPQGWGSVTNGCFVGGYPSQALAFETWRRGCCGFVSCVAAGACGPLGTSSYRACNLLDSSGGVDGGADVSLVCLVRDPDGSNRLEASADGTCPIKPPKNLGCPKPSAGNPINPGFGNKYQREADYLGTEDRLPLEFVRHYNSRAGLPLMAETLGAHWRSSYDRAVIFDPVVRPELAVVLRPDGRSFEFRLGAGGWTADADVSDRLIRLADTTGAATGWEYRAGDDTRERYDNLGRLLEIVHPSGAKLALTRDAGTGHLLSVRHSLSGRTLSFSYDTAGRIETLTDPAGQTYTYAYDSAGNLAAVNYPDTTPADAGDNPKRQYHYNEPAYTGGGLVHALTGITDENGSRYALYRYSPASWIIGNQGDADGFAIASEHAGGAGRVTLTYNRYGTTTVADALGTAHEYAFVPVQGVFRNTGLDQPCATCGGSAAETAYDTNGNIASRTDFNGNRTCHGYDLARNLETVRIEGLAPGRSCPANPAAHAPAPGSAERKILTAWHPDYRLPVRIDEAGRRTAFVYDTSGNLVTKTLTDTATGQVRAWTWTYNALGQVVSEDGPRTDVADTTLYEYYADTQADWMPGDLKQVTNAVGQVTRFTRYDRNGRVLARVDPNGMVTETAYTPRGWLREVKVTPRGSTAPEVTAYAYDGVGQMTQATLPDGSSTRYTYDAAHRLTGIEDSAGNRVEYTLDAMGNRIREDWKDAGGTLRKTLSRAIDALNRVQQVVGGAR